MNRSTISMEEIEEEAEEWLTADPLFEIQDGVMPVIGLLNELDVLEDAAERQFDRGDISQDTRLGILIAVAGLRRAVRQASFDFTENTGGSDQPE